MLHQDGPRPRGWPLCNYIFTNLLEAFHANTYVDYFRPGVATERTNKHDTRGRDDGHIMSKMLISHAYNCLISGEID